MDETFVTHESLPPFYSPSSRVLILGSFPSIASRAKGFYYAHPQNRFFRTLSLVFEKPYPVSTKERKEFLLSNHIALYDVLYSCTIKGSSDSSIKDAVPADLSGILSSCPIRRIFTTGKTATDLFRKFHKEECFYLPSPSGANAFTSMEKLVLAYKAVREAVGE
ncbi:MAG: DNA-deoxyinosine glycosylase [Bacilli bacterium]